MNASPSPSPTSSSLSKPPLSQSHSLPNTNTNALPRPQSPTKPDLKPNPHPYAIKTTSTGALSRSNSSPHNPQNGRSFYVPESPSKNRQNSSNMSGVSTTSRPAHAGHRYSRSLTTEPPPIPVPAMIPVSARKHAHGHDREVSARDLPENPKAWTPSQLSVYLATALRVTAGALPPAVVKDIASFVRQSSITGKRFLRFNEDDLEDMAINELWRTALLTASRNLRQNVLRGRIWQSTAFPTNDESNDSNDSDASPSFPLSASASPLPHDPNSYTSTDLTFAELSTLPRRRTISHQSPLIGVPSWGKAGGGGMYASASMATSDLLMNTDGDMKREGGHAPSSAPPYVPPRSGRVRGMVATFERGASESEGSGSDYGGMGKRRERTGSTSSSSSSAGSSLGDEVKEEGEQEMSIEALLAAEGDKRKSWSGVDAWEVEDGGLVTVKRVVDDSSGRVKLSGGTRRGVGDLFGDLRTGGKNRDVYRENAEGEDERSVDEIGDLTIREDGAYVLLDAFAQTHHFGTGTQTQPDLVASPTTSVGTQTFEVEVWVREGRETQTPPPATVPLVDTRAAEAEEELKNQIDETRSLVENFRRRLEAVEGELAILESEVRESQVTERREREEREREREEMARRVEELEDRERERKARARAPLAALLTPGGLISKVVGMVYPMRRDAGVDAGLPLVDTRSIKASIDSSTRGASSSSSHSRSRTGSSSRDEEVTPTTLSGLPPYILMVSIGVCAVVLRVVIGRVAGKRLR